MDEKFMFFASKVHGEKGKRKMKNSLRFRITFADVKRRNIELFKM
jgi:hypothetical protein